MSTDDPNPSDLPPAVRETLDSLGGALGDIAELDKEQLNETIGLLETLGHDQAAGILRSRRDVLKGAGAATGLGIAGLAGATATSGARAQSDTQTGTIGNGNQDAELQDVSAESVNTDSQNNDSIIWISPGDNLQSRFDAVPDGGIAVFEDGVHDVSQMGTATIERPLQIRWSGGNIGNDAVGAVLDNSAGVDGPIITVQNPDAGNGFTTRPFITQLINPNIIHTGANPAIQFNRSPKSQIVRPNIQLADAGDAGVQYADGSWGWKIFGGQVEGFTDVGVDDATEGGNKAVFGTRSDSAVAGSVGIRCRQNVNLFAGSYGGAGTGIEVTGRLNAAYAVHVESADTGIDFTGTYETARNNQVYNPRFGAITDNSVRFDDAVESTVVRPRAINDGSSGAAAVNWTANSSRCGVEMHHATVDTISFDIDSSAFEPFVDVVGSWGTPPSNAVEGMDGYNLTDQQREYYDGTQWVAY